MEAALRRRADWRRAAAEPARRSRLFRRNRAGHGNGRRAWVRAPFLFWRAAIGTGSRWRNPPTQAERSLGRLQRSNRRHAPRATLTRVLFGMRRLGALALAAAALQRPAAASANSTAGEDSTSDFVALYYKLFWQAQTLPDASPASTETADAITLARGVPGDIVEELRGFSLTFEDLPSLLQRAVLWDAGYVLSASGDGELATILTDCERASTMADVALSAGEMADAACSSVVCSTATSSSSGSWTAARECESFERLESLVKCASTSVGVAASADVASIWSTGNGSMMKRNATPSLLVWRHDTVGGSASSILAIHSASESELSQTGTGASPDQVCAAASTLVIPCVPYAASSSARWCRPGRSPLLARWLREYAELLGVDTSKMAEGDSSVSNADGSSNSLPKEDDSGVVINPDFQFDGRSSDLAQQFYRRHVASDQVDTLALATVPKDVEEELNSAALQFSELPPLLQRALLWDSGYVQDGNGGLVQIYTECGLAMSDLMLSTSEVQDAGCVTQTCTSSALASNDSNIDDSTQFWRRAARCDDYQAIATTARCAVKADSGNGSITAASTIASSTPVWANGASNSTVPNALVHRRLTSTSDANESQTLFALQLISSNITSAGGDEICSPLPEMVVPCAAYTADSTTRWCRPKSGALVTSWLQLESQRTQESQSSSPTWYAIVIPVAVIVAVVIAAFGLRYRSVLLYRVFIRRRRSTGPPRTPSRADKVDSSTTVLTSESSGLPSPESDFLGAFTDPFPAMVPTATAGLGSGSASGWIDLINSMKLLLESRDVCDSVIAFQDLQFHHLVGRGSCGEVWLCLLFDRRVAAKRLLKRRRKCTSGALEMFTNEILLTASLSHPHIVRFVGVASSTLHNLWLVTEYMENGDLHHCLQSFGTQLSWRREKLQIAIGIVRGLCYLHHDLSPAVVHCDLKPRNVLLTSTLEAKLTDFGTSRHRSSDADDGDGDRAASEQSDASRGSDAPLWLAPEVLQSREFSRKADMYSLGLVLCELDTLRHPFADAKDAKDVPPLRMLQRIADGRVQPQLSCECPPAVAELVASCLSRDPSSRPSALDAFEVLDAMPAGRTDTFSF